jgi:hypothetical protein
VIHYSGDGDLAAIAFHASSMFEPSGRYGGFYERLL